MGTELPHGRSVSTVVLTGTVDVPQPPARLVADWERDIRLQLALEPGDVEALSLARTQARWPDYARCVQLASLWLNSLGLPALLTTSDVALMVCRGAREHHDGAQYSDFAFCNLFLSEDCGLDLLFPATGQRIPLQRGTVVLLDTCQPHTVIDRHRNHFDATDFPPERDCSQVFLTWELPMENEALASVLQIQASSPKQGRGLLDVRKNTNTCA